jgi:hypothetical protein
MSYVLLLLLLPVCSFAPGFFFLRRLRWSPMEKLCGSVGLSLVLLYLATWGIYCARVPGGAASYWAVTVICAAMAAASWKDMRQMARNLRVRRALTGQILLWGWAYLILAMIRLYSGAGWFGDDIEHFQRSLFFLHRFPPTTPIWGDYLLPARPPMMNVLGAFFMAQTRDGYDVLQLVFTFLNSLLLLPCCLILPALVVRPLRRRPVRYAPLALAALFALNPAIMQAATYAWTKSLAAFFVVLGLGLYLAGWRKADRIRTTAAFISLAAALLVHYSAGPYCAFLALHYLARVFWRRPRKWRELAGIAVCCGLLLATWFGWAVASFGLHGATQSNSSVTFAQRYQGNNFVKIGANLVDTVIPPVVRDPSLFKMFEQPSPTGTLRDHAFVLYQLNMLFGMGLVGGPLALWILYRAFRGRKGAGRERSFWLFLVPFCAVVGIAVVGERDFYGVAHLTLLSMMALGVTAVAAALPLRRGAMIALMAGLAVDFSLGIFLQERIQSRENSPGAQSFNMAYNIEAASPVLQPVPDLLSIPSQRAWYYKHQYDLTARWLNDLTAYQPADAAAAEYAQRGIAQLQTKMREDQRYWGGWFSRHENRLRYFGDVMTEELGLGAGPLSGFLLLGFAAAFIWLGRRLLGQGSAPFARRAAAGEGRRRASREAATASRSSGKPGPKPQRRA